MVLAGGLLGLFKSHFIYEHCIIIMTQKFSSCRSWMKRHIHKSWRKYTRKSVTWTWQHLSCTRFVCLRNITLRIYPRIAFTPHWSSSSPHLKDFLAQWNHLVDCYNTSQVANLPSEERDRVRSCAHAWFGFAARQCSSTRSLANQVRFIIITIYWDFISLDVLELSTLFFQPPWFAIIDTLSSLRRESLPETLASGLLH